jgi:hypothetical protein
MPDVLPLAHAGHWLEGAFFAPAMLVVLAAIARSLRHGRQSDAIQEPDPATDRNDVGRRTHDDT